MSVLKKHNPLTDQWEYVVVGKRGLPGDQGFSAYEVAVNNGFAGTEQEWLNSLADDATITAEGFATAAADSASEADLSAQSAAGSAVSAAGSAASIAEALPMMENLIVNGDFSKGTTGWASESSSSTVTDGILTNIADGSATYGRFSQFKPTYTPVAGTKVYVSYRARVTNDSVVNITSFTRNAGSTPIDYPLAQQLSPVVNTWYNLSGIATLSGDYALGFRLYVLHSYESSAVANGKSLEVSNVLAIDLTAAFGAGNEPSKAQMDSIMDSLGGWFDGEKAVPVFDFAKNHIQPQIDALTAYRWIGSGSPYGVLTPTGAGIEYTDTAQTNGARKWISTGTTTTSWAVLDGDTGQRNILSLLKTENGWTTGTSPGLNIARFGNLVQISVIQINRSATGSGVVFDIPAGFRPNGASYIRTYSNNTAYVAGYVVYATYISLTEAGYSFVYKTSDPWPTTLPGTPF